MELECLRVCTCERESSHVSAGPCSLFWEEKAVLLEVKDQNLQQTTWAKIAENLNYMAPIIFPSSPDWSKQAKQEQPVTRRSKPDRFFILTIYFWLASILVVLEQKWEAGREEKGQKAERKSQKQKRQKNRKQLQNTLRDTDNVSASEKIITRPWCANEFWLLYSLWWYDFVVTSYCEVLKDGRKPFVWVHYTFTHISQIRHAWAGSLSSKVISEQAPKFV